MNEGVACYAWVRLLRTGARAVNGASGDRTMALIAERVDAGHVQQARILRAVRSVAAYTTLRFDGGMLEDERPARLRVAFGTNGVLVCGGAQIRFAHGAVRIMTIAALHQAFVDLVMEGHVEEWLYVRVALEAELWLIDLEQLVTVVRAGVHAMTC